MTDLGRLRAFTGGLLATTLLASPVWGEAVLDGSTGSTGTLSGDFEVPVEVGRLEGPNLFHSFERFHIRRGESATFTGPSGIDNVVSRVTGDEASRINGLLRSTVPGADFWFLNPRGIAFGRGARLDVDGSFHASTADELRFGDGEVFSAADPGASSFTVAAPEAFGFLGDTTGSIEVNRGQLVVGAGENLSLIGGEVTVTAAGSGVASGGSAGRIVAPGGTVTLAALTGPATIEPDTGAFAAEAGRDVTLTDEASVDVTGERAGIVRVRSGRLFVDDDASLASDTVGAAGAGEMSIISGRVAVRSGGLISADTFGPGDAGRIEIDAGRLTVADGARVRSEARDGSSGDAGTIEVFVDELRLRNGAEISGSSSGLGDAGQVRVVGGAVEIDGRDGFSGIFSNALAGSAGSPGTLRLTAGELRLRGRAEISSSTFSTGSGGSVRVTADEVTINGGDQFAGIFTNANTGSGGDAGSLDVQAGLLTIRDNAEVSSSTFAEGSAGSVRVRADEIVIDPRGGFGGIFNNASAGSTGDAGSLDVAAGRITMFEGAEISSSTFTEGAAGSVRVQADEIVIDGEGGFAGIFSQANDDSGGDAGLVQVRAGDLRLFDGAQVSSSTFSTGSAGAVSITADVVLLDGSEAPARIANDAREGSSGDAGNLQVAAGTIAIVNSGVVSSSTFGSGSAGSVRVSGTNLFIDGGNMPDLFTGVVSQAEPGSSGPAGNVSVVADVLSIENGGSISSSTFGAGDAGAISVRSEDMFVGADPALERPAASAISSTAFGGSEGDAGSISVEADFLTILGDAVIESDTRSIGDAGAVAVVVTGNLTLDALGSQSEDAASISSDALANSSGDAGPVTVVAGRLDIVDRAFISSDTLGAGDAGTVTVEADRIVAINSPIAISSSTFGDSEGAGGTVVARADVIRLTEGGGIVGNTRGPGDSGAVTVEADKLVIDGGGLDISTGVASDALAGGGNAGPILVRADNLVIRNGGRISSDTRATGDAGPVVVDARRVAITDDATGFFTGISSDSLDPSADSGDAGNVLVTTNRLFVDAGGSISSSTSGGGRAGQVLVVTDDGVVRGGIATSSTGAGAAGTIALAADRFTIENDGIVTSEGSGAGPAGNILLRTGVLTLDDARITTVGELGGLITTDAGAVRLISLADAEVTSNGILPSEGASIISLGADDIVLNSSRVTSLTGDNEPITGSGEARLLGDVTVISTDSEVAASSTLEVTGLESDLTAGIEVLPSAYIDVSGLLRESCAARASEDRASSFATTGGRGLAPDPAAPLTGRYAEADDTRPAAFRHWTISARDLCDD